MQACMKPENNTAFFAIGRDNLPKCFVICSISMNKSTPEIMDVKILLALAMPSYAEAVLQRLIGLRAPVLRELIGDGHNATEVVYTLHSLENTVDMFQKLGFVSQPRSALQVQQKLYPMSMRKRFGNVSGGSAGRSAKRMLVVAVEDTEQIDKRRLLQK